MPNDQIRTLQHLKRLAKIKSKNGISYRAALEEVAKEANFSDYHHASSVVSDALVRQHNRELTGLLKEVATRRLALDAAGFSIGSRRIIGGVCRYLPDHTIKFCSSAGPLKCHSCR